VLYSKYAGTELAIDGSAHVLLKEDDVIGTLAPGAAIAKLAPLGDRVLIKVLVCWCWCCLVVKCCVLHCVRALCACSRGACGRHTHMRVCVQRARTEPRRGSVCSGSAVHSKGRRRFSRLATRRATGAPAL
jgi:hypothetical protein